MRQRTWTICRWTNSEMEVLTTSIEGGDVLPVFGFEEEAEMYLNLQEPGSGWRIRETTGGELISILYGPCARVRWIALDPPPEVCKRMHALSAGLNRRAFLRILAAAPAPANSAMRYPQRATRTGEDGDGSGRGNPLPSRRPTAPVGAPGETVHGTFSVPDYAMRDLPALERASEALKKDAGGGRL